MRVFSVFSEGIEVFVVEVVFVTVFRASRIG